jgi:hypothetical protein
VSAEFTDGESIGAYDAGRGCCCSSLAGLKVYLAPGGARLAYAAMISLTDRALCWRGTLVCEVSQGVGVERHGGRSEVAQRADADVRFTGQLPGDLTHPEQSVAELDPGVICLERRLSDAELE